MIIVYCETCGIRVDEKDLESGAAIRSGEKVYHAKCAPAGALKKPSERLSAASGTAATAAALTGGETPPRGAKSVSRPLPKRDSQFIAKPGSERAEAQPLVHAPSGPPKIVLIGGAAALVIGLGLIFAFTGSSTPESGSRAASNGKTTPAVAAPEEPKRTGAEGEAVSPATVGPETTAQPAEPQRSENVSKEFEERRQQWAGKLLDEAREFARKKPEDQRGLRDKLNVILRSYRSTPAGEEAAKLLAELKTPEEAPAESGLLPDGTFESGKDWKPWGGAHINEKDVRSGKRCARLPKDNSCGMHFKISNLKPNTQYELAGWVKCKGEPVFIGVKEYGGPEKKVSASESDYTQIKLNFTAVTDTATIFAYKPKGKSSGFADDLTLVELGPGVPEANVAVTNAAPVPAVETLAEDPAAWKNATNLLATFDPVEGTAQRKDNGVHVSRAQRSRIHLASQLPAEYDLRVSFVRAAGEGVIVHVIGGGGRSFAWVLSADGNKCAGFSQVKGNSAHSNPSTVRNVTIEKGRTYTTVVQVRNESVKAFLDGKLITSWNDLKDMGLPPAWKMRGDTQLGFGCEESEITWLSAELLDRSAAAKTQEPSKADAPVAAAGGARLSYEKMQADVFALLVKDGFDAAFSRLDRALADPQLSSLKGMLKIEREFAADLKDLRKPMLLGAALLVDKRPFVFKKLDGKETPVGKGSSINVTGVKDDTILIEEAAGGGKIQASIDIDSLALQNRYELARLGLPAGGESSLKLAYMALVMQQAGLPITDKEIQNNLETARKGGAPEEKIKHLTARLDWIEKEGRADADFKKIEALIREKKGEDAKTALQAFRTDCAGTRALERLEPNIQKALAEIEVLLNPLKPGLWMSCWSGDDKNKFKTKHLARPETKISQSWGGGSPDKSVPADNFGVLWQGLLRIEQEGKYKFIFKADDSMSLTVDGKGIKTDQEVTLTKGDKEIKIVYAEGGGSASLSLKWKPENGAEQDLPASALFHDPRQTAKYEVK